MSSDGSISAAKLAVFLGIPPWPSPCYEGGEMFPAFRRVPWLAALGFFVSISASGQTLTAEGQTTFSQSDCNNGLTAQIDWTSQGGNFSSGNNLQIEIIAVPGDICPTPGTSDTEITSIPDGGVILQDLTTTTSGTVSLSVPQMAGCCPTQTDNTNVSACGTCSACSINQDLTWSICAYDFFQGCTSSGIGGCTYAAENTSADLSPAITYDAQPPNAPGLADSDIESSDQRLLITVNSVPASALAIDHYVAYAVEADEVPASLAATAQAPVNRNPAHRHPGLDPLATGTTGSSGSTNSTGSIGSTGSTGSTGMTSATSTGGSASNASSTGSTGTSSTTGSTSGTTGYTCFNALGLSAFVFSSTFSSGAITGQVPATGDAPLTDGVKYGVQIQAVDTAGNVSACSNVAYGTPYEVNDFWRTYVGDGGSDASGCTSIPGEGLLAVLTMAGSMFTLRRRRWRARNTSSKLDRRYPPPP